MQATAPVALITGSSRGIGLSIARALGHAGHRLLLTARDPAPLAAAADALTAEGLTAIPCAADLRHPDSPARVIAFAHERCGPITVLINNAGTAPSDKLENTSDAMLTEAFDLHVRAPLALLRACLPTMKARNAGCIVQLASTAGLRGYPFTAAYTAAKHGMVGLTRAAAAELARTAIAVYAVCPGFVDTDITRSAAAQVASKGKTTAADAFARLAAQNRIGRMHTADEVAAAVTMLVQRRPAGCIYDLDRDPPAFVD